MKVKSTLKKERKPPKVYDADLSCFDERIAPMEDAKEEGLVKKPYKVDDKVMEDEENKESQRKRKVIYPTPVRPQNE
jgi:hypothetical protein